MRDFFIRGTAAPTPQHKQCGDWPSLQGVEKHFGLSETPMLFEIVYTRLYCGEVVKDFREIKKSII